MATLIPKPTLILAAGNPPKTIEEFIGRVNSGTAAVSIARMKSPPGWSEPGQTPEFDEYTVVLQGCLHVKLKDAAFDVAGFVDLSKPLERMSSGVLVNIEGHLFVATAAHAVPLQPGGQLSFVLPKTQSIDAGALPILRHGKVESEWPDVGFLELDPETTLSILGKEPIGLDKIGRHGPGHPKRPCFLFGYTSVMARTREAAKSEHHLTFRPMCFSNPPMKPEKWPDVPSADPAPDQAVDIYLPYDPAEEIWYYEENERDEHLPEPRGASGGGLWQCSPSEGAEKVQLLGVQSRWIEKEKYVRGCQIIPWLRLLHEHYSDLRPALVAAFPEVG